jgi:hypothetical protein
VRKARSYLAGSRAHLFLARAFLSDFHGPDNLPPASIPLTAAIDAIDDARKSLDPEGITSPLISAARTVVIEIHIAIIAGSDLLRAVAKTL